MAAHVARAVGASRGEGGWRLLAIPGTPSRPYMFSRLLRLAPPDWEVVVPMRAGFGGPSYGSRARTPVPDFDDQVRAIAPLFDKDDGRRTIALGVSYGGALALKTALDHPDRVAGVMTLAMLVREPRKWIRDILPLADWPGVRQALPASLHTARSEVATRRTQIGALFDRLSDINCPVTILHGDLDMLVPESDAHFLKERFAETADVAFTPVSAGTHYLELQTPRLVYRELERLVARANGRASADGTGSSA